MLHSLVHLEMPVQRVVVALRKIDWSQCLYALFGVVSVIRTRDRPIKNSMALNIYSEFIGELLAWSIGFWGDCCLIKAHF